MGAGREPLTPLRQAVEDAYRVFKAAAPQHWSGDDIGVGKEDWERLSTVPLRELTRSDTYHFLTETGVFNRHEVRYMLPRILDLLAAGEEPHAAGDECSLSCLAKAGYPEQWTEPERAAIDAFFSAMLDACLEDEEFWERRSLETLLCVAGCANADVGALLARADRAEDQGLARAVAPDIDWVGGLHPAGGLVNAFWQSARPEHAAAVDAWYRRPELLARVEQAFFEESDPDWQKRISDAVEAMRGWRTS